MSDESDTTKKASPRELATRLLDGAVFFCAVAGMCWVAFLMVVMNVDIFGRYLFNAPLTGTSEFVSVSVSALVFLLLPQTVRSGRMTRVTIVLDLLQDSHSRLVLLLDRSYLVLGAVAYAGLARWMWPRMVQAYERGAFIGSEGVFQLLEWPIYLVICIGCVLAALSALARLQNPMDLVRRDDTH